MHGARLLQECHLHACTVAWQLIASPVVQARFASTNVVIGIMTLPALAMFFCGASCVTSNSRSAPPHGNGSACIMAHLGDDEKCGCPGCIGALSLHLRCLIYMAAFLR